MEELYQRYYELRNTENHKERLVLKAQLAQIINEGNGQWLIDLYKMPTENGLYGEVLSNQSDGNALEGRREPSLAEAVLATFELDQDYKKISEVLKPRVKSLVRIGSTSWARYFDVKRRPEDMSDLDVEVIMDTIDPSIGEGFPGAVDGLKLFRSLHRSGKADYFAYKCITESNRPVSIHFVPSDFFKAVCYADYESLGQTSLAYEFRTSRKTSSGAKNDGWVEYDGRHDSRGNATSFWTRPTAIEGGQITETCTMMVGKQSEIIMGLFMDKYFTFPAIEGDSKFVEKGLRTFKTSLANRVKSEGGGNFSNFPSRRDRMPFYILKNLDEEQQRLISASICNFFTNCKKMYVHGS